MISVRSCSIFAFVALLGLAGNLTTASRCRAATPSPPDVLIINSYAPGYAWSDDMLKGVLDGLQKANAEFEPITMFLDFRRFPDRQREAWLVEDVAHKCRVRPPRLIITLDNAAFEFALQHRERLGRDIPLIFGGLNRFTPDMIAGQKAVTGVSEETDFSGTFQLMRALRPAAKQVLVIGNATDSSAEKRRVFDQYAARYAAEGYVFEHYDNWTNAQLIERVARLPDTWVGLVLDVTRDAAGANNYNNPDFSTALATRARVPLFLTAYPPGNNDWSRYQWDGLGGGVVVATMHGEKVAELALRVLTGEDAGRIPVVTASPQRLVVDHRQMLRHGLTVDQVPAGTVVMNAPVTYYQINRERIIIAGVMVAGLCVVIAVLSINILRRRRAELALRHTEERLRAAQKLEAVGLLAGGVAHDFNNILQVIRGHTEFLRETVAGIPSAKEDVATITAAADRASRLTRQLLAFSRRQPLQFEELEPNELVGGIVKMLGRVLSEDIDLQAELLAEPARLVADRSQIEQVLINLCVNARDAMPGGGRLTIRLALVDITAPAHHSDLASGLYLEITVQDNGQGIAPEIKSRLFEPFFTTKSVGKGTGLGLAVVHGVVHQHHGSITVASTPGQGTSFRILLPALRGSPQVALQTGEPIAPTGQGTILLAEDDVQVRHVAVKYLEMGGYHVLTAADGVEAEDLVRQHHQAIRLVILDVIMPKRNGREVYDFIREKYPCLRVLFCSGYSADMLPPESAPDRDVELLSKPYSQQELLVRVQRLLQDRP